MIGFGEIASLVTGVIDRVWPNPNEEAKVKLEALKIAMASEMQVHKTNQEEAKHKSIFVAGWRPAVGWVCVGGLTYGFIAYPLLTWASTLWGIPAPPALDIVHMMGLLGGMLGFGAYRTYEGVKGTKRSS